MDNDQEKIAIGERGDAATCGPSPGPGCSAVPPLHSAFQNFRTAMRDCETAADFLGVLDKDEALIWANNAIRQIESAKAKILASQNPTLEARTTAKD